MLVLFAIGTVAGMVAAYGRNLPDISRMADYQPASTTRIFARDGTQLASVYKENRVWVPLSRIPEVVRQAFIPSLQDKIPYVVIAVELDGAQGARIVSNLVDVEPEEVTVGMAVEVAWEDMGPELAVPRFRPAAGTGGSR